MASTRPPAAAASSSTTRPRTGDKTFFETQRDALVGEIAVGLEHVLQNINKLNRSLEGVIAVGTEFSSVEALWSQFESVMAKDPNAPAEAEGEMEGETGLEEEDETGMEEGEGQTEITGEEGETGMSVDEEGEDTAVLPGRRR